MTWQTGTTLRIVRAALASALSAHPDLDSWTVSEFQPTGGHGDPLKQLHVWFVDSDIDYQISDARGGTKGYDEQTDVNVVFQAIDQPTGSAAEGLVLDAVGRLHQILAADPSLGLTDSGLESVLLARSRLDTQPYNTKWHSIAVVTITITAELLV